MHGESEPDPCDVSTGARDNSKYLDKERGAVMSVQSSFNRTNYLFTKRNAANCLAIAVALAVSAPSGAQGLEEIVVTAEKRGARSIMDTAFSVGALTGEQLESQGVISVMEGLAVNPGVSVYKFSGTGNFIQIRSISAVKGDATVGYYLDDLPYTMLGLGLVPDVNPYDLERLEVLRGPQGTLYGASSLGGTVRVLTNTPDHDGFYGKATAGYSYTDGGDDSWQVKGAVNIPLIDDTLSARLVASKVETGGFIDLPLTGEDDFNDATDESYRAKLRWTPTDNLDMVLSAWHFERDSGLSFAEDDFTWSPVYGVLDALTQMPVGTVPVPGDDLRNDNDADLYNFRLSYDFGDYNFLSATSYIDAYENQDINYFGVPFYIDFETETLSHEMRLSFTGNRMSWTAGVFYVDLENTQHQVANIIFEQNSLDTLNGILESIGETPLDNPFESEVADQIQTSEQLALFGEIQYDLSDTFQMTIGLRYFEDDREFTENNEGLVAALEAVGLSNSWSDDFSKTTGRFNLSWTPGDDSLYYLNIAQGFRSGTANGAQALISAAADPLLNFPEYTDPEDIISYELGSKLTLMDGRLAVEAAVYYLDWSDVMSDVNVVNSAGIPSTVTINANDVEGIGLDLGVTFQASDGLVLALSGNINQTEFQDDVPGAGISKGDQVTMAPESTLLATATYNWDISGSLSGVFRASYQYTDERSDYLPGVPVYTSDDIATLGVRLGLESDRWQVYLSGENLTDEDGEVSQLNTLAAAGVPANRLRPLTVGIEATLNF